jgi:hypothetical protein
MILTDDNYKEYFGSRDAEEFKIAPTTYRDGAGVRRERNKMGVFLCLGQNTRR